MIKWRSPAVAKQFVYNIAIIAIHRLFKRGQIGSESRLALRTYFDAALRGEVPADITQRFRHNEWATPPGAILDFFHFASVAIVTPDLEYIGPILFDCLVGNLPVPELDAIEMRYRLHDFGRPVRGELRAAFEAAWMANHKQLAVDLLHRSSVDCPPK
jgi:hypothetical protein